MQKTPGIIDRLIIRYANKKLSRYYSLPNNRSPSYWRRHPDLYEMELVRACIHARAMHISKLVPTVTGNAYKEIQNTLAWKPNEWQTTSQFLYRLSTILDVDNTAYILPVYDERTGWICGYYPALPKQVKILSDEYGEAWLEYTFANGEKATIELKYVGVMTRHQYENEIVGEDNTALEPTLKLINVQNEGIMTGVENAANFQFYARSENFISGKDLKKESANFTRQNFGEDNKSAVLLFPNTYTDIHQMQSPTNVVNPKQLEIIRTNVFDYYNMNDNIIQNKAVGDDWSAFYEGCVEVFAVQLSQVMTNMTYSHREIAHGNCITWTGSRLQTMSNADKLNYSREMFDRGLANQNMINSVWGLPPVPGGEKFYIRKEYAQMSQLGEYDNIQFQEKENLNE